MSEYFPSIHAFPRDLNALVTQQFFRCVDCKDLYECRPNGAQHALRCRPCNAVHKRVAARAMQAVLRAIKRGDLPAAKDCRCVDCGLQARIYDHRSYASHRLLDVEPVCSSCNQKRGPTDNIWNRTGTRPKNFLPAIPDSRHSLTQIPDVVDCAAITLMGGAKLHGESVPSGANGALIRECP